MPYEDAFIFEFAIQLLASESWRFREHKISRRRQNMETEFFESVDESAAGRDNFADGGFKIAVILYSALCKQH